MKVIFFSKGDASVVSSRYRSFYFADELNENGLEAKICSPPPKRFGWRPARGRLRELMRLARELSKLSARDIAYLQRPLQNLDFIALLVAWKTVLRRKMVFDFCDPVFMHSPRKTKLLARRADAVVVSCEDLAVWARRYNSAVHIVPNCPKPEVRTRAQGAGATARCVIGWAGSAKDHKENLRLLFSALARVNGDFTFRLIGARGADDLVRELEQLDIKSEIVDWLEPDEAETALAELDIALLPVRDTLWNKKLLTKLIDYLAAGLPIVASPVGENRLAIDDGRNGFLAATEEDWAQAIDRLIGDPDLRRSVGENALETARTRYSLADNGRRLATILTGISENATQASADDFK